jgi:hypothetical protein
MVIIMVDQGLESSSGGQSEWEFELLIRIRVLIGSELRLLRESSFL